MTHLVFTEASETKVQGLYSMKKFIHLVYAGWTITSACDGRQHIYTVTVRLVSYYNVVLKRAIFWQLGTISHFSSIEEQLA